MISNCRASLVNALIQLRKSNWSLHSRIFPHQPVSINYVFRPRFKLYPAGQIAKLAYVSFFERSLIRHALEYVKPGMLAIDVGANIGLWTIWLGRRVGPCGHVHAFEPGRDTIALLNNNIKLNRLNPIVSVYQQAVGNLLGSAFLVSPDWGGDADRFLAGNHISDDKRFEQVHMTTLDHWAQTQKLQDGIQFIKIDCEGSELRVLQGARELLTRTKHCMAVCEYNTDACSRQGYHASEIYDFLEYFGFAVGYLHPQTKRWTKQRPPEGFNGNLVARKD
jgi:FkbM family methyltransferase